MTRQQHAIHNLRRARCVRLRPLRATTRDGALLFAVAHLDHTELDIVLVSSITSKPLTKPYATFLIDAYSRRLLAVHVSYRSVMMAFRLCVQRYGRLPQEIVVDHGPEFGSVYFEALLSQCFVTKINRPPKPPHFGSVIERIFGTTTSEFLLTSARARVRRADPAFGQPRIAPSASSFG